MSDFPEILNRFITEKNIHVYSMVKYCDIDRSTMYKIIKGTRRPPSEEIHDNCLLQKPSSLNMHGRYRLLEKSIIIEEKMQNPFS